MADGYQIRRNGAFMAHFGKYSVYPDTGSKEWGIKPVFSSDSMDDCVEWVEKKLTGQAMGVELKDKEK
jgi:uncharacterized protein YbdZ (MbtH family)